jgi:hypothetical protein
MAYRPPSVERDSLGLRCGGKRCEALAEIGEALPNKRFAAVRGYLRGGWATRLTARAPCQGPGRAAEVRDVRRPPNWRPGRVTDTLAALTMPSATSPRSGSAGMAEVVS